MKKTNKYMIYCRWVIVFVVGIGVYFAYLLKWYGHENRGLGNNPENQTDVKNARLLMQVKERDSNDQILKKVNKAENTGAYLLGGENNKPNVPLEIPISDSTVPQSEVSAADRYLQEYQEIKNRVLLSEALLNRKDQLLSSPEVAQAMVQVLVSPKHLERNKNLAADYLMDFVTKNPQQGELILAQFLQHPLDLEGDGYKLEILHFVYRRYPDMFKKLIKYWDSPYAQYVGDAFD
ncbi:MAG: hypothetical protein NZ480_01690 [Bdellovibrionaceae bacterium]|nr:hypothetical protein [Pseudobdellovibrionaceae bacterium]MDW8189814.1 hypothetical protein [Pseudobdellovibrionaceae bacterium]